MAVPSFNEIRTYHALRLYPKRFHPQGVSWISSKKFRNFAANFELGDDGVLYLLDSGRKIEILEDDSKKDQAFKKVHCAQHDNIKNTCTTLGVNYFWFGMENDVANWIKSCETCKINQKKQQENCKLVLYDHCYTCNFKEILEFADVDESRFPLRQDLKMDSSMSYAKRHHRVLQNISTQQAIQINSSNWEHDYIADKLTMRRKLHSFIQEDQCQLPTEDEQEHILLEREAAVRTAKETQWKSTHFNIDYRLDFLPNHEDTSFIAMLGLENISEILRDLQNNETPSVPSPAFPCKTCVNCGTDVTPSWHLKANDDRLCKRCYDDVLREGNIKSTKRAFTDYQKRFSSNFKLIKEEIMGANEKANEVRPNSSTTLTKLQKKDLFKANVVTKTLLRNKGITPSAHHSEELYTKKIRQMMAVPSQDVPLKTNNPDNFVQALTKKHSLQEYLQWRLQHHKTYLAKQMNIQPKSNLSKVSKASNFYKFPISRDAIRKHYQISVNDLQKLTKQLHSSNLVKLRREVQTSNIHSNFERQLKVRTSKALMNLKPVQLRALSKKKF